MIGNFISITFILGLLLVSVAGGQSSSSSQIQGHNTEPVGRLLINGPAGASKSPLHSKLISYIVAGLDEGVREEFHRAWWIAGGGNKTIEAVVLLYRKKDGSLMARSQGCTNERFAFTFKWNPTIIAIVHTHPNVRNAQPEGADLQIADKFRVPVFTITNRGMFVYDPATRRISRTAIGLAWLGPSVPSGALPVVSSH